MDRRLARLDPRCVRLHHLPVDHGADRGSVPRAADRSDGGIHRNPVAAAGGRRRLRLARRSHRAQDAIDDLDPVVLDVQPVRRPLAELRAALPVPRAARHRHGCGVARRRRARHGVVAGPLARPHERRAAGVVEYRLPAVEPRLRTAVRQDRLARLADPRRSAGFGRRVDSHLRQGAEGVGGEPPHSARAEAGISRLRCSTSSAGASSATPSWRACGWRAAS